MVYDVRDDEKIDTIRFSEDVHNDYLYATQIQFEEECVYRLMNDDCVPCSRISNSDIKNLVKAIKKAGEIWGDNHV